VQRENNNTVIIQNLEEMKTGLAKNSQKGVDLGGSFQQLDFGVANNYETSIIDNSMSD